MFYVYMVFADILAQQTTNVKQNQVLGITETVGFTMMCDTGAGAVEMWKTAVRFPHIPTALLRCLRRFSGLREKKVANRDGLC